MFTNEMLMRFASWGSIATALVLISVKSIAFYFTNSLALLSSLFDSCLDLGASLVSFIAIQQSLVPADSNHRFGHGKAEALGGVIQGIIIFLSATLLLFESIQHLTKKIELQYLGLGLGVTIFAIFLTLALVLFQRGVIKKTHSISILADQAHYIGDIIMNVGVILSMLLSYLIGWVWVDSIFALLVAGYLFYTSIRIINNVFQPLMDKELPSSIRKKIRKIALSYKGVKNISDLRTRTSGLHVFIQFHAEMKDGLTLKETHDICSLIEEEIGKKIPYSETFIHQEP